MPQFDQISFTNQVFSFLFFFLFFYFFISYILLPNVSHSIKFRKKKINKFLIYKNLFLFEKKNKQNYLNNSYETFALNYIILLQETIKKNKQFFSKKVFFQKELKSILKNKLSFILNI